MTSFSQNHQYTKLLRLSEFNNLELMTASFTTHTFPRHFHENFVIEIVEAGVDEFYCRNRIHTAPAGSIVVINPGEVHTGRSIGSIPLRYRSLYPAPELLFNIAAEIDGKQQMPHFSSPVIYDKPLADFLQYTFSKVEDEVSNLRTQSLLLRGLSQLIIHHSDQKFPSCRGCRESRAIKRAKAYILENYWQNISLARLSQIAEISPFYLLRCFRNAMGIPPYEFLINVRIERAKQLLGEGEPIAAVANATGFYDQSHLNKHFKRIVGMTPGQYH